MSEGVSTSERGFDMRHLLGSSLPCLSSLKPLTCCFLHVAEAATSLILYKESIHVQNSELTACLRFPFTLAVSKSTLI